MRLGRDLHMLHTHPIGVVRAELGGRDGGEGAVLGRGALRQGVLLLGSCRRVGTQGGNPFDFVVVPGSCYS